MHRPFTRVPAGLVAAVLAAVAMSACGTTVPGGAQGQTSALGDGLGGGLSSAEPGATTPGGVPTTAGTTSTGSVGTTDVTLPGSVTTRGAVVTPVGKPVEVGFAYSANAGAFLKALGIDGEVLDGRIYVAALLKHINARGGLAGHPVKPVYYNVDLTRTDPYAVWMAEMCAMWTQDHHVLAAIVPANSDFSPVAKCLSKSGAVFGNTSAWVRSASDYRTYPNWFESQMITGERLAKAYVDVPEKLGYFSTKVPATKPKIGLLIYDYPQSGQMANALIAQLKAHGYPAPITQTLHMGQSTAELSGTIASAQSAALKFAALGVDHVMSVAYPGAITFFAIYANTQGYHPRYAFTSFEGLIAVQATAPKEQLKDAVAVGWLPDADVDSAHKPPPNSTTKTCLAIYKAAGLSADTAAGGLQYCDFLFMLREGSTSLTSSTLSGPALHPALEHLGTSYLAPGGYGTAFGAGKHDGVTHVRPVRFDAGCTCFVYAGPAVPAPR